VSTNPPPSSPPAGSLHDAGRRLRKRRHITVSGILVVLAILLSVAAVARPIAQRIVDDNHRAQLFDEAGDAAKILAAAIAKGEFDSTTGVFDPTLVTVTANKVEYAGRSMVTESTIKVFPGVGSIATEANAGRIDPETRAFCVQVGDGDLAAFYSNVGISGVGTCAEAEVLTVP
jgi:hypothetical protein